MRIIDDVIDEDFLKLDAESRNKLRRVSKENSLDGYNRFAARDSWRTFCHRE